jgi:integrase
MDTVRFPFTAARLQAVPAPTAGATQVYDETTPGLALRVTAAGARTFVLFRRLNGRTVRMKLGSFRSMSIPDARKAAQQIAGKAAAGMDVVAERAAARARGRTVGDTFATWLSFAKHRKRSWEDDKRLWELWIEGKPERPKGKESGSAAPEERGRRRSFPSFAKRPIREVTTGEIENIARAIGEAHPRTANKLRALLSTVWNHAMRRGDATSNPVRFVERFPEHSRERFLQEAELLAFLQAVADEPPTWRDYFLIGLLTGQRRENLSRMRWDEIDLDAGCWHIPASKAKSKRATTIPLTTLAVGLLRRRREEVPGEWVFPSYTGSKDGCVREPRKPWQRVLQRAGISNLRLHDLRRSVGSWLGASGTNSYTIARALGHQSVRSGEVYVRLSADPVRDALHAVQLLRPALDEAVRQTLPTSTTDAQP